MSITRARPCYQVAWGGLAAVVTNARFPAQATVERAVVLAPPLDFLAWTAPVAAVPDALNARRREQHLERCIVPLAGTATARTRAELERRAVEIEPAHSF